MKKYWWSRKPAGETSEKIFKKIDIKCRTTFPRTRIIIFIKEKLETQTRYLSAKGESNANNMSVWQNITKDYESNTTYLMKRSKKITGTINRDKTKEYYY